MRFVVVAPPVFFLLTFYTDIVSRVKGNLETIYRSCLIV